MQEQKVNKNTDFLVLLYGELDYDGRVLRMVKILNNLGNVTVLDIADKIPSRYIEGLAFERISLSLPKQYGKLVEHLCFWKKVIQATFIMRPKVIVAEDYFTLFPAVIAAKLNRLPLIYDAHELIIPTQGLKMTKRDLFWYYLERISIHHATLVIAANKERAEIMKNYYQLKRTPIVMRNIPQKYNLKSEEYNKTEYLSLLSVLESDSVLVLYQGNVDCTRGLERFVDAMNYLPPHFKLVIVGSGPCLDWLKDYAKKLEQEKRFLAFGRVPNFLLLSITQKADLGIVSYPYEGLNNLYCSPNKLYEYAQAGLPVVATDQPPLKYLVEKYDIGGLVGRYDSPQRIAAIIQKVALRGKEGYWKQLQKFVEENSFEEEAEKIKTEIKNIIGKGV